MESEVWLDRNDLMTLVQRDALSCLVVRMEDARKFPQADLFTKQRLDLELVDRAVRCATASVHHAIEFAPDLGAGLGPVETRVVLGSQVE